MQFPIQGVNLMGTDVSFFPDESCSGFPPGAGAICCAIKTVRFVQHITRRIEIHCSALQFIETIERCDFVGFCQGWVIEHGVAKIFQCATHREDGLADVHDFRRTVANHMHA